MVCVLYPFSFGHKRIRTQKLGVWDTEGPWEAYLKLRMHRLETFFLKAYLFSLKPIKDTTLLILWLTSMSLAQLEGKSCISHFSPQSDFAWQ